jgi:hypothetical protein
MDRALDAFCNFSAERPWALALIVCACILAAAAVPGSLP